MSDLFDQPSDATPLEPEEREGLRPSWISNRSELNQAEQANIAAGVAWVGRSRRKDLLTEEFIKKLHTRMFGDVWTWAGDFRKTERNIGIDPVRIPVELRTLLDDVRYWIDQKTFSPDEIAVCFHHRLVAIHPFPNGNGRTARLLADLLVEELGGKPFTWGRASLTNAGEARSSYIDALRAADRHDIGPLLAFARS
jgi:Fic-DOC domain mobile mystery protein B